MIALSFRTKLLLAMLVLVAGVTGATLYVTQRKFQAVYQRLLQEQFEAEVNYFTKQQEARLGNLKEPCLTVTKSTALLKALSADDATKAYYAATNSLLKVVMLRDMVTRGLGGGRALADPETGMPQSVLLRLLDAQGRILHSPGVKNSRPLQRKRLEEQLTKLQGAMDKLADQQVALLARQANNNTTNLMEVIVTKISDPVSHKTLGALVLGIVLIESSETAMKEMSSNQIQSGILLENQVHSKTIPRGVQSELAQVLEVEMKEAGPARNPLHLTLGGIPRSVFFKLLNPNSPFPPAYEVSLYSMADAQKTEHELRTQILAYSGLALMGALAVILLIAHGLSIPLRELVAGTTSVRNGDLEVRVPVRSRDEIGELAASFNEMAEGLSQKEMYRTVLNMVTDEKVAQALVDGQLALGGDLKEISVLFCDIRGFTALTRDMPPKEVVEMLNEHMTILTGVVKQHNGVVDKFVGDLFMAIFGAPVERKDDTLNAARCGIRLIRERERLNTTSRHRLKIGVGIATGKVVAGCMGSYAHRNYTVVGERVNLASRLCGQAGPGQVVIDQTTREKLGDDIAVRPLPALTLKGFAGEVQAFELTEVHSWELELEMG
ncbi:MAG TPA: adenylate/guanylate cyclase domain-containing protein [Terriglobales bacterium]|nr:adenylate/guanylate cyclase domain-containing protein [Terriglobales bacterium]